MRIRSLVAAALLVSFAVTPALAQTQRAIAAPANASWKHTRTGIVLPAAIAGTARDALIDNSATEIDVIAEYGSNSDTTVTYYLFRPGLMSVPVWFDRSETQIMVRDIYANPTAQGAPTAFAPPRGTTASALRRVYVPGGGKYKSTALATMPLGDWLVVVRISSQQLDAAGLDARLSDAIAALGWPDSAPDAPAAAIVAPCSTPLAYAKNAKLKAPDMTDALLGATLATLPPDPKDVAKAAPVTWCREGAPTAQYAVYRANNDSSGYSIAINDAGAVITVSPGIALGKGNPGYRLSPDFLGRTMIYPSFNKLPSPQTAIAAVNNTSPMSSTERGSNNVTIIAK